MKPKAFKKQNAAAVDDDGTPLARAQHIRKLMRTVPGNGGESPGTFACGALCRCEFEFAKVPHR